MPSTHIIMIIIVTQRPLTAIKSVKFFTEYDMPSANVAHLLPHLTHSKTDKVEMTHDREKIMKHEVPYRKKISALTLCSSQQNSSH